MDLRIWALLIWMGLSGVAQAQRTLNVLPNAGPKGELKAEGEDSRNAKIMKQINKVNDDGSYTFGYEADDGSFRVETRSKDGVVKGKYGYVDATGTLKVMEYTAGEKTQSEQTDQEEEPQVGPPVIPQKSIVRRPVAANTPVPRYALRPNPQQPQQQSPLSLQSKPLPSLRSVPLARSASQDQTIAAQTPTAASLKYNPQQERQEKEDESEEDEKEDEKEDKDVNNGQYFRALPVQSAQEVRPGAGQEGPRYIPSHQLGGQQQRYAGFSPQFTPQSQQQGGSQGFNPQAYGPALAQQQGFQQQQGFPGQQQGFQQQQQGFPGQQQGFRGGFDPQQQQQGFPIVSAYPNGRFEDEPNSIARGQGQQQPQFGGQNPNVQVQFRGSPQEYARQPQSPQSPYAGQGFGQQRGGDGRALFAGNGNEGNDNNERYVPNLELDGYSEDADEDGYVDDIPNEGLKGQAQEKQGVAVKAVGPGRSQNPGSETYRPTVLGPQGVLQGGKINLDSGSLDNRNRQPQLRPGFGGAQGQSQPGQNQPFFGGGGQGQPQLTQEQFQQFIQQQNEQFGSPQQGLSPQAFQQGQFPGQGFQGQQGQGFPQGFPPQQQSQFIGGGGSTDGNRPNQRPQQFLGQQNPLLQGQYVPGQGQFPQQQFTSGGPQGRPQNQGQFLGQQGQGQFLPGQQVQGQFLPGQQGQGQFSGQQGQGQFLQGGQGLSGLPQQGFQGSPQQSSGGGLQSSGFPFDFNLFGGLPGQGGQSGQGQQLSQAQLQALQGQGFNQGGPLQGFNPGQLQGQGFGQSQSPQGFPPGALQGGFIQGGGGQQGQYSPGRFPPGSIQQQQTPQLTINQGRTLSQGQPIGQGVRLSDGVPRPVQAAGSEDRKQVSSLESSTSTKTAKN